MVFGAVRGPNDRDRNDTRGDALVLAIGHWFFSENQTRKSFNRMKLRTAPLYRTEILPETPGTH